MTDKFKLAIIGGGGHAKGTLAPLWKDIPEIEPVATCDAHAESLANFAELFSIENTYSDAQKMLAEQQPGILIVGSWPGDESSTYTWANADYRDPQEETVEVPGLNPYRAELLDLCNALSTGDPDLLCLRRSLPLNGETSFADTAAAFAALPDAEQARLSGIRVRRHSHTRNDTPEWIGEHIFLEYTTPREVLEA